MKKFVERPTIDEIDNTVSEVDAKTVGTETVDLESPEATQEAAALLTQKQEKSYNSKLHTTGQIWTACGLIVMCMVPLLFGIILGTGPDWGLFFTCMALLIYYLPIGVVEVLTYSYMLGVNGTYLAFITGNLSNLKIPCVINAVNIAGTEVGTEEHEIASTISVAVSAIVTVLVIAIGVLALAFSGLQELLASEQAKFLTPAFGTVAFALFGALGGKYLVKNPKIAIVPFIIMVAATVGLTLCGLPSIAQPSYFIFVGVIACLVSAIVIDKNKKKKLQAAEKAELDKIGAGTQNALDNVASELKAEHTATKAITEAKCDTISEKGKGETTTAKKNEVKTTKAAPKKKAKESKTE